MKIIEKKRINEFTADELRAELEKKEAREAKIPQKLESIDWGRLTGHCCRYVQHIADNGNAPKGGDHFIYAKALEAVFGGNIWDWVDEHDQGEG